MNVLSREQLTLAAHFGASGNPDKLAAVEWVQGQSGMPLLTNALARFECEVLDDYSAGDHRLVVGRVLAGQLCRAELEPLLYRDTDNMDGAAEIYPDKF